MKAYKKCPLCGYKNPVESSNCGVCQEDISKVNCVFERRRYNFHFILILIFAFCLYFFASRKTKNDLPPTENYLNSAGIKTSLKKIAKLKIPDEDEKRLVFENLTSADKEIKMLAFRTLLIWSCNCLEDRDKYLLELVLFLRNSSMSLKNEILQMAQELTKQQPSISTCLRQTLIELEFMEKQGLKEFKQE